MTGLDPARHVIVEIATLITDDDLAVIAEGPDLVVHAGPAELAAMEPVVRDMHTRSGLLGAIESSTLTLEDAGRQTLEFLKTHVPDKGTVPLCGNSIGTDRRFLAAQLPDIENWLHYRSVDVSTVKELCRRWYPGVLAKAPEQEDGAPRPRRRPRVRGRAGLLPPGHLRRRPRLHSARYGTTGGIEPTALRQPRNERRRRWTFAPSGAPACGCPRCASGR